MLTRLNGVVLLAACALSLVALNSARALTPTTIGLASPANPSVFGEAVTFIATMSTQSATGSLVFTDGGSPIGTVTIDTGIATFTISSLALGTHTIVATYAGNGTFGASTSNTIIQQVNQANAVVVLTPAPNPSVFGQAVSFTAFVNWVSPASGTPTGTVTFTDGVTPLGSVGLASGLATFTTATLSTGPHTITATYSGDTNFAGAADTKSQIVAAAGTTTFLAGTPNPGIFGQSVTFTATTVAVAPGAGTPAGIVSFFDGGTPLGSASLDGSGVATLSTTSLVLGSQNITAVYAGSTSFTGSTGTFSQTVTAGTTTALTAVPNPSAFARAVTFTASVTPATPGTPTGTVTFKDGASTLGVVTLSSGTATFTTSALAPGLHSVTAVYSGHSIFTARPRQFSSRASAT